MSSVAVYGASGFVGKRFIEESWFRPAALPREEIFAQEEQILYLISTTHNYSVLTDPHLDIDTNLTELMRRLRNVQPGQTFNFVSSWFVYGHECGSETAYCTPKGFYAITKHCAEQLVRSYCTLKGIKYRILRLANVYGPGDKFSQQKNALTYLINEVKQGKNVNLYWGGKFSRNYIHISDVVRALDLCLSKAPLNEITNVGAGTYIFGDLIYMAKRYLDSPSELNSIEPTGFHAQVQTKNFYMDTTKLQALGFVKSVIIQQGIEELCRSL